MSLRSRNLPLTLLLAVIAATAAFGACAQDGRGFGRGGADRDGDRGALPRDRDGGPPRYGPRDDGLSDSVRRIERSTRSQVLSAERIQSDGRDVNRIKVMDDRGRVRVYMDDPQQPEPRTRRDDN